MNAYIRELIKRKISVSELPMIIGALYSIVPGCRIVAAILGYDFLLRSYPITIALLSLISVFVMTVLLTLKTRVNKVNVIYSALLPLLSVINGFVFIINSDSEIATILVLICCFFSIVVLIKCVYPTSLKVISTVLSVLLILLFLFIAFIDYTFKDFDSDTVVKSVTSPRKTYIVEVIACDHGALGGDTFVEVRNTRKVFNYYLFKLSKSPLQIYFGDWGEFETMRISWRDEHTLLLNGKEYYIDS